MLLTLTLVVAQSMILVVAVVLGGLDSFVGFCEYMCSVSLCVWQTGFIICLSWETIVILHMIAILGIKLSSNASHCPKLLSQTAACVFQQIVEFKSKLTATLKQIIPQPDSLSSLLKYCMVYKIVNFPFIAVSQFKHQLSEKPRTQQW